LKEDINPKSAEDFYNLGLTYYEKNEFDKAIESFKNTLEIDPKYVAAWYDLGYIYKRKKEYDKAIEHYNKALEINPEHSDAWHGLALSYHQQNEFDQAIEYTKNALEIDPEYQQAWQTLGSSHYGKKEYDKAIKYYKNALELDQGIANSWYGLGVSYYAKRKYSKAIECYKNTLEINPELEIAWKGLSLVYTSIADFKNAEKAQNRELKLISHLKKEIIIKEDAQISENRVGLTHFDPNNLKVELGGDWKVKGDQSIFLFKTKITNNSAFVLTNIQILLTSLPSGLDANVDRHKISILKPSAFESPVFKLKATESCVGDYIEGIVTFMDPSGKQLTKGIRSFRIDYVCSLLIPKLISKQEFDNKTELMEKEGITIESDLSASELKDIIQSTIIECNFALRQKLREKQKEDFRNFEAYAQGIYDKQDVALSIVVKDLEKGSQLVVNAMSNETAKVTDILKDCSIKLDEIKSDTQLIKEYSSQIEDIFEKLEKLEDIENYLQQKLASDWDKIKGTWQRYKSKEIDLMEFLKDGTKIVGKRFIKKILGNYI